MAPSFTTKRQLLAVPARPFARERGADALAPLGLVQFFDGTGARGYR
jgi:hypothetical protein